jgi:predicted membrane metal-binding protein
MVIVIATMGCAQTCPVVFMFGCFVLCYLINNIVLPSFTCAWPSGGIVVVMVATHERVIIIINIIISLIYIVLLCVVVVLLVSCPGCRGYAKDIHMQQILCYQ